MDGGAAFLIRDGSGQVIRSQITWGYGHALSQSHLRFDQGLDDEGQLALARWLTARRTGWAYTLYPQAAADAPAGAAPGAYARVTGRELPGYAVAVQRLEIVYADGSTELMVETGVQGENPITLELSYLQMRSVLLPSWSNVGDGYVNMERRLANFRTAQAMLDQALAGEITGGALGTQEGDGITLRYTASCYQTLPCALRPKRRLLPAAPAGSGSGGPSAGPAAGQDGHPAGGGAVPQRGDGEVRGGRRHLRAQHSLQRLPECPEPAEAAAGAGAGLQPGGGPRAEDPPERAARPRGGPGGGHRP